MATRFYCSDAVPASAPTAGTKAGSLPKSPNFNAANSGNEGSLAFINIGTAGISRTAGTSSTAVQQSDYFGRFSSIPLAAQTIPAQNWNWAVQAGESANNANMYIWPVMYVWRPSTSAVVGYILNTSAQGGTELTTSVVSATRNYAGSSVTTQDGDILVAECWLCGTPTAASYTQTWNINTTASFIDSPATILFSNPLAETFKEDFEGTLDTNKWLTNTTNGTATFGGGVGNLNFTTTAAANNAGFESKNFYDIRNSSVFVKVPQCPRWNGVAGQDFAPLNLESPPSPGNNRIGYSIDSDGNLRVIKYSNGTWAAVANINTGIYPTLSTYTWFRIRESAGTMYFDTAPSTASDPPVSGDWVNRASVATSTLPINPSAIKINDWIYNNGAVAITVPAQLDALNTGTTSVTPATANLSITEAADTVSSDASVITLTGIQADLSVTEAADSIASAGLALSGGSVTVTEAPDSIVSSASAPIGATLTRTEAADTVAATAGGIAGASLTRTEAADTSTSTASTPITANSGMTEAADTSASTASTPIFSSLGVTEAPDTIVSSASSPIGATLSQTEAADTVLSGGVVIPFPVIGASLSYQESPDYVSSTGGSPTAVADAHISEAPDSVTASASSPIGATLTRTEAADVVTSSAGGVAGASLARTEAADSIASSATSAIAATLSKSEFDDTSTSIVKVAAGASLSITEAPDTVSGSVTAILESIATLSILEGPDKLESGTQVVTVAIYATLSVTEQNDFLYGYTVKPKKRVSLIT